MGNLSRRKFLAGAAATAAAATTGMVGLAGMQAPQLMAAVPRRRSAKPSQNGALVAHVRNVSTGEVAVMLGAREVVYRDRALVAHLLDAVRG